MRLSHPNDELGGMLLLCLPQLVVHELDDSSPLVPPLSWRLPTGSEEEGEEEGDGEGEGDEGTTKSLSKEAFCKLHVEVTPNASLSEAELLFDVLKSGHFSEDLSLDDVLNLEHLLDNASSHTVRAGVSGKTLAKR